mmetsp:Transcript_8661/g.21852  ORF Transcript_8661/g.21852 Transcript_8661/m.21852 type:complete len:112 (-) Transcript_8661:27-362(-)
MVIVRDVCNIIKLFETKFRLSFGVCVLLPRITTNRSALTQDGSGDDDRRRHGSLRPELLPHGVHRRDEPPEPHRVPPPPPSPASSRGSAVRAGAASLWSSSRSSSSRSSSS